MKRRAVFVTWRSWVMFGWVDGPVMKRATTSVAATCRLLVWHLLDTGVM